AETAGLKTGLGRGGGGGGGGLLLSLHRSNWRSLSSVLQRAGSLTELGRVCTFYVLLFPLVPVFVPLAGLAVCPEHGRSDRTTRRIAFFFARRVRWGQRGWRWKSNPPLILSVMGRLRGGRVRRGSAKCGRIEGNGFSWCRARLCVGKSGRVCFHEWWRRSARF
uniref:Uncharacterized protein n=1 Tax=Gasterosteus aculeatus TaxID=69293 RepID=G3PUP9_GASAC